LPDTAEFSLGIFLYCGTTGRNFSATSHDKENLIAEVDLDLQENVRQNWPFLEIENALEILQKRLTNLSFEN
jgi:N-carbamoylputrescine amidase